jgi:hypothetical protein
MKGYQVNIKTGKIELIEDEIPFPKYPSLKEPKKVDLEKVSLALKEIEMIKKRLARLENRKRL